MADLPKEIVEALERAGAAAEVAVAMVDRYPEEYRVPILVSLLRAASGWNPGARKPAVAGDPDGGADMVVQDYGESPVGGLRAAAAAADVVLKDRFGV